MPALGGGGTILPRAEGDQREPVLPGLRYWVEPGTDVLCSAELEQLRRCSLLQKSFVRQRKIKKPPTLPLILSTLLLVSSVGRTQTCASWKCIWQGSRSRKGNAAGERLGVNPG